MLAEVADKFMLVPRPKREPSCSDTTVLPGASTKPVQTASLHVSHSTTRGTNGDSRWSIEPNGPPPPSRPGPKPAQSR